jgi:hypothetical protein
MRKIILIGLLCLVSGFTFAQQVSTDSLTYQLQRAKINHMLDDRRAKFGQYDQSLTMHTGIFGLQTKKDIRRSNDILMDIAKTDENIFREIKVLMDYRVYQQQQVQTHSTQTEDVNLGFMGTINKLRHETDRLKQELQKENEQQGKTQLIYLAVIVLMLGSILYLIIKKRAVKA